MISVIIPVYNRTDKFRGALSSVVAQTYENIEIIVVDDGSFSHAVEYAMRDMLKFQKYGAKKINDQNTISRIEHIQYIRQENKGAPAARNRGLEAARGEYVIFWDADVVGESNMLAKMVDALKRNSGASFAYCNFNLMPLSKKMRAKDFSIDALRENNFIHSTSLIRKKDVVRWDETLRRFQDWDLWLTMVEQGKTGVWIDEYLYTIISSGTISSWLPGFVYKKPWSHLPWVSSRVKKYNQAKEIIKKKHDLT